MGVRYSGRFRTQRWVQVGLLVAITLLVNACGHRLSTQQSNRAEQHVAAPHDPPGAEMPQAALGLTNDDFALFPPISAAEQLSSGEKREPADIYTYVLFGAGQAARPWRHAELELLRLIDTYVTAGNGAGGSAGRHRFLIPVYAGLDALPLTERSAPELSEAPRANLAGRLEAHNRQPLAMRLRTAPGPFLVSRTEPPWATDRTATPASDPLLVTDLSHIGVEYLYPVIDAYDRPIPPAAAGTDVALIELHRRLTSLEPTLEGSAKQRWVFLFGTPGTRDALFPASERGG